MKKVAVLLPILNEADNIAELLQRLQTSLSSFDARIFIVDDGSTDGTIQKIEQAQKTNPQIVLHARQKTKSGCRRGEALVYGLHQSVVNFAPHFFVELDGDLSHNPEEIEKGIAQIETGADIALGSKYLSTSKIEGRGALRNFISYANSLLFRVLLGFQISDYSNGFRVYNRKAADVILAAEIKYGSPIYLAEAISLWKLAGLKFFEFAITYNGREKGKSKVIFSDVLKGLVGAMDISIGHYRKKFTS